jgi:hypothetical protein
MRGAQVLLHTLPVGRRGMQFRFANPEAVAGDAEGRHNVVTVSTRE